MRALVISGGGSKGAFAGGVAEYLIDKMNNDYDIYIGTSTGSLLVTHLALKKTQILKRKQIDSSTIILPVFQFRTDG